MVGAATISLFCNTFVLLVNFQGASRSEEETRRFDETFLMTWPGTGTEPLLEDGFVGYHLSTYQARGTTDLTALLTKWVNRLLTLRT